jgi:hypothetical protein
MCRKQEMNHLTEDFYADQDEFNFRRYLPIEQDGSVIFSPVFSPTERNILVYRDPTDPMKEFIDAIKRVKRTLAKYNLEVGVDYIDYTSNGVQYGRDMLYALSDTFRVNTLFYYPDGAFGAPRIFDPNTVKPDEMYDKLMDFIIANERDEKTLATLKKIAEDEGLNLPIIHYMSKNRV